MIVVHGPLATVALPWDIEQHAAAVLSIRLPGPPDVRAALAAFNDDADTDRAIAAVAGSPRPHAALLTSLTGVEVGTNDPPLATQLRLAARLAGAGPVSAPLGALAARFVTDPLVVGLLDEPADATLLQEAWQEYTERGSGPHTAALEEARTELAQLFAVGVLQRVPSSADLPGWARVGVRVRNQEEQAQILLAAAPEPFPPNSPAGWIKAAEWWGNVRRLVASAPAELADKGWQRWTDLDEAFRRWLRVNYGSVLSSSARWPAALHGVAPFLARRMRDGATDRVLLIVLDGLGHAQWPLLRDVAGFEVVDAGSTFAMVPTYTTVSRQAIFAGDLPAAFPESLWTTQPERRRWVAFWEGEDVRGATYHRVRGLFPYDRIEFGASRAVGVVVNAVDDLMHSSELMGDAQLLAGVDLWAKSEFLVDLVRRGTQAGYEVWVTSDHGNLECRPAGEARNGLVVESAGKRLLRYENKTLRDEWAVDGIVWDAIPGLPPTAPPLRFAPGRLAYTNHRLSISHGGLSLDEVIVPLARVTA